MGTPTSTTPATGTPVGQGWVTYAAVLLTVGAVGNILWGLAALKDADTWGEAYPLADSTLVGPLEFWGWVAVVWSVVLAVGAALLFSRRESGRVVGVTAASLSAVFWLVAMPAFPLFALTAILLDSLAIYGLVVHWPEKLA
jgi:hypothetical protein